MTTPKGYERRYTGRRGRVAHLLFEGHLGNTSQWYTVACGLGGGMWKGTGSQDEYDRAAALPLCENCVKQVSPREVHGA